MKRLLVVAVLLNVVVVLMSAGSANAQFQNEPDGFRGIKWATPLPHLGDSLIFVGEDSGVSLYSRKGDSLKIGNTDVLAVKYGFWQGKFYTVQILYRGDAGARSLKEYLFKEYGEGQPGTSREAGATIFGWGGYSTTILYKYFQGSKEGRIVLSSSVILRERRGIIGGNYPARPTSAEEFDRVTPERAAQAQQVGEGTLVPALPATPGFYRVEDGKYLKQPDCRGDECKMCVPKDWVEAVGRTPVSRRTPTILLQSLIVPPQKGQGVPSIITLPVDSPTLTVIDPVLKAVDSSGETLLLSFKEDLVPGTYTIVQRLPGAVRYAKFTSAQDSICFVALNSSSKYLETQAAPLGVFVVR